MHTPTDVSSNTIWIFMPTTTEKSSETPTSEKRTFKSTETYYVTSQSIYSTPTLHSGTTPSYQEYQTGSHTLKNGQAQAYTSPLTPNNQGRLLTPPPSRTQALQHFYNTDLSMYPFITTVINKPLASTSRISKCKFQFKFSPQMMQGQ